MWGSLWTNYSPWFDCGKHVELEKRRHRGFAPYSQSPHTRSKPDHSCGNDPDPQLHCGVFLFYRWPMLTSTLLVPPNLYEHLEAGVFRKVPFNLFFAKDQDHRTPSIKTECMAMIITVRCLKDRQKLIDTLTNAYGNERVIYCRYQNGEQEIPSSSAMCLSEE